MSTCRVGMETKLIRSAIDHDGRGCRMARALFETGEFFEVYMSASLEVCERRDAKGLYRLARDGKLQNFTGISSPYESPEAPEVVLDTSVEPIETCVRRVVDLVMGRSSCLSPA